MASRRAVTALVSAARRPAFGSGIVRSFSSVPMPDLDNILIITPTCAKRIKQLQEKGNNPDLHLRVSVEGGGCSGFQYNFEMDHVIDEGEDNVFEKNGSKVVIDHGSFEMIKGSTVDFVQEMIRSTFAVVNNPQSEGACGCGSSFAVKNFDSNPALD
ncbi:iron-sulfur cluster assembly 2-like protein [Ochromonadaceae sp. CCMP2298]|nr:iron-sulfur cluster assembly 2-like protein [Ochromonadaceae sp. CCMP2298]